jgi:hypothetical protein
MQYNWRIIVDDEKKVRDLDVLVPDGIGKNARNTLARIGGPWSENRNWDLSGIKVGTLLSLDVRQN